ncbi:hypothetical protein, partial [Streptomyces sp. NPDC021139]|uniref:hypothetical protein n=1 Tax=Streptomyces sp. NPDC021139 TaxID=3154899 RepID=UPI0033C40E51
HARDLLEKLWALASERNTQGDQNTRMRADGYSVAPDRPHGSAIAEADYTDSSGISVSHELPRKRLRRLSPGSEPSVAVEAAASPMPAAEPTSPAGTQFPENMADRIKRKRRNASRAQSKERLPETSADTRRPPYSTNDVIFIVELDGHNILTVHSQRRRSMKGFLKQRFWQKSKPGMFFDQNLRFVELNPNVNGATSIDDFFRTQKVLLFQRSDHANVSPEILIPNIAKVIAEERGKL